MPAPAAFRARDALGTASHTAASAAGPPGRWRRCAARPTLRRRPGREGLPSLNERHGFMMRERRRGEVITRERTLAGAALKISHAAGVATGSRCTR
jgi:hypothetical protein